MPNVICTKGDRNGPALGLLALLMTTTDRPTMERITMDSVFGDEGADAMAAIMVEMGVEFDGKTVTDEHILALFRRLTQGDFNVPPSGSDLMVMAAGYLRAATQATVETEEKVEELEERVEELDRIVNPELPLGDPAAEETH